MHLDIMYYIHSLIQGDLNKEAVSELHIAVLSYHYVVTGILTTPLLLCGNGKSFSNMSEQA